MARKKQESHNKRRRAWLYVPFFFRNFVLQISILWEEGNPQKNKEFFFHKKPFVPRIDCVCERQSPLSPAYKNPMSICERQSPMSLAYTLCLSHTKTLCLSHTQAYECTPETKPYVSRVHSHPSTPPPTSTLFSLSLPLIHSFSHLFFLFVFQVSRR